MRCSARRSAPCAVVDRLNQSGKNELKKTIEKGNDNNSHDVIALKASPRGTRLRFHCDSSLMA